MASTKDHGGIGIQHKQNTVFHSAKLPISLQQMNVSVPLFHSFSFCFKNEDKPPPKPLLDIEDVRAFIRSKIGPPKPSTSRGAARRVQSGIFGIGTMGSSTSDGGYVHISSSRANEHQGQISSHPPIHTFDHPQPHAQTGHEHHLPDGIPHQQHSHYVVGSYEDNPLQRNENDATPFLDLSDVRDLVDSFLHHSRLRRRPTSSWVNKMPWHDPRPPFLAKGLEWPPDCFDSEEQRKEFYRKARKRKPFLLGSPPLWSVPACNVAFLLFLIYNPIQKFFQYLEKLP